MRPLRSFLLLLIFLACFTGLHYIIPANQLFPPVYEFIPKELIASFLPLSDERSVRDTISIVDSTRAAVVTPLNDSLLQVKSDSVVSIDTADSRIIQTDPLKPFYDSLLTSKGQIRIMYYGDSQVEGDRITSYLRSWLRHYSYGEGPGLLLPVMPVMYTKSVALRSSSNWQRYNYLSFRSGEISHRSLGPFMTVCRFMPEGIVSTESEKAWVTIKPSAFADSSASDFRRLRILYGNSTGIVRVTVSYGKDELLNDTLSRARGINELSYNLSNPGEVRIEFSGTSSPDIYGISLESNSGVIVDNIPQRGSAGLEFTMVDRENLAEAYRLLSPDLIVMQYGLNIVRNVRKDYTYYEKGLYRQISRLREVAPGASLLLVGVTDMAAGRGDSIVPYSNIPAIIKAQKRAASETGIAFWDAYSAMGGEQSVLIWSSKTPPLIQKDLTHFTYPGADTISRMLVESLFLPALRDTHTQKVEDSSKLIIATKTIENAPVAAVIKQSSGTAKMLLETIFSYDPSSPLIFSTAAFWLFFLIVLAGYSLVYKKMVLRNTYLFIFSLFFYYKSGGLFLLLLIFITIIDFTCGILIHNSRTKAVRRFFIIVSILSNLGILAYFKYTGFFIETINDIAGTDLKAYDFLAALSNTTLGTKFDVSNIVLPVGVSFFTFQSLSYTIDVYRKRMDPVRNILDFGFYVSFFPQLVAGPIVRASEFIPQLYTKYQLTNREFSHSLFLISKGLIKKIIISDFIATAFIDRVFDAPSVYSGFENLMAIYGYGLQIYCDFSGYTDIAIGLGLILGFRLPVNFNSPYKATDIADFWKRWHISLSRWLKDYLYIPLGGNRKGKLRTNINLMITMLLGGLWHGASVRFIIWGFLHGIGLVINRIWCSIFGEGIKGGKIGKVVAVFLTFHFVTFCWIFFRAPDMESVRIMLSQIFENFSPGSYSTVLPVYSSAFLLIAAGYIIHFLPETVKESYRGIFIRIPLFLQLVVVMGVAILLYQMRSTEVTPFIYFRF